LLKQRLWLQQKRNAKLMTHEDVAVGAHIQRAYYTMIENGRRNPSVDVAKRIAAFLNFDWTIFFSETGNDMKPIDYISQGSDPCLSN